MDDHAPHSTQDDAEDPNLQARRRVLTVLAVAPAFAACALGSSDLPIDNQDPDNDGAASIDPNGNPLDSGPGGGPSPGTDSGSGPNPGTDSGSGPNPGTDSGSGAACTPTGTLAGAVAGWNAGTWKKISGAFVGRDSAGFYALRSICTHNNSCQLRTPTSSGISCPCHGGQFDLNGNVTLPPPPSALRNYQVNVCNGNVYVNTSVTVAQGTRANP